MSKTITVVRLNNGQTLAVEEPIEEIIAAVQDPGGAPFLELCRTDGQAKDEIWVRASSIVSLQAGEVFSPAEMAASFRAAQMPANASGKQLS